MGWRFRETFRHKKQELELQSWPAILVRANLESAIVYAVGGGAD